MEENKEYRLQDFCDLLGLKETRTKEILKPLISDGKIFAIGKNKDRRYKLGQEHHMVHPDTVGIEAKKENI